MKLQYLTYGHKNPELTLRQSVVSNSNIRSKKLRRKSKAAKSRSGGLK